jgi:hypothetical protein
MTHKLVICTPCFGSPESAQVSVAYHEATRVLSGDGIQYEPPRLFTNCDLVRARSRAVTRFLESDGTHLLFWDSDVVPRDVRVIWDMIDADKDVIALPYPRKKVNYENLADAIRNEDEQSARGRQTAHDLEAGATEWPLQFDGEPVIDSSCLVQVKYAPCGFMMIKRECLEKLVEACRADLSFKDSSTGIVKTCVAIFMLILRDGVLMSEDYSFCERVRNYGMQVWAYLDPADHIGPHRYRGRWQSLVDAHV